MAQDPMLHCVQVGSPALAEHLGRLHRTDDRLISVRPSLITAFLEGNMRFPLSGCAIVPLVIHAMFESPGFSLSEFRRSILSAEQLAFIDRVRVGAHSKHRIPRKLGDTLENIEAIKTIWRAARTRSLAVLQEYSSACFRGMAVSPFEDVHQIGKRAFLLQQSIGNFVADIVSALRSSEGCRIQSEYRTAIRERQTLQTTRHRGRMISLMFTCAVRRQRELGQSLAPGERWQILEAIRLLVAW